ncbi:MAG: ribosome-associated translation inhibitor RaiA [Anaerolineales bacterium]|nr:ribosome-associated translation inhibitor RaiA [Anaerolineales bacterium]
MSIQVEINVKNFELSDRLQDYVETKVGKLDRYLDILEEATLDLTHEKNARDAKDRQVAQLTLRGKGVLLRAEERTEDIFASIDLVVDKISRQIERYKGRRWRSRGDGRSASDFAPELPPLEEVESEEKAAIARRKKHLLLPMDEREAIAQMELLDHEDFFIFLNGITNQVNVLYRRRNGTLGLIETEQG